MNETTTPTTTTEQTDDYYAKRIAVMLIAKQSVMQMSKELGISRGKINRIIRDGLPTKYMDEMGTEALATAKQRIRQGTAKLVDLIIETLEVNLKNHDLKAVPHALTILGIKEEEKAVTDTNIQVILPGPAPTPIRVKPDIEIG